MKIRIQRGGKEVDSGSEAGMTYGRKGNMKTKDAIER